MFSRAPYPVRLSLMFYVPKSQLTFVRVQWLRSRLWESSKNLLGSRRQDERVSNFQCVRCGFETDDRLMGVPRAVVASCYLMKNGVDLI